MSLQQTVRTAALATSLAFISAGASAGEKHDHDHGHDHDGEHRQHGTHVHGVAALNLVLEGNEVHVELDSPAANIVGFEHAPSSDDDRAALDRAMATLKGGDQLFEFNKDAGCRMQTVKVTSELLDDESEGAHADEHEHAHKEKEGHDHDEHAHEGQHEHEGEGETHSDIDAAYHFECGAPDKLTRLSVELFEAFSGMEELKVQYVIESKQGAAELTAKDHVVKF
jgi:hypothetical protein